MRGQGKSGSKWLGLLVLVGALQGSGCEGRVESEARSAGGERPVAPARGEARRGGAVGRKWAHADRNVVALSNFHALAVSAEGSVWAWGGNSRGELGTGDLVAILDPGRYPPERHDFLLQLMRKFELCFRFPEEEHKHLHEDLDLAKPDPTRDNL